jgi:hypothetical protein
VFEIPQAPPEQGIDLTSINVEYIPGDGGPARRFGRARQQSACDDSGFFIEGDRIELCPEACRQVEADRDARVNVLYACVLMPQ